MRNCDLEIQEAAHADACSTDSAICHHAGLVYVDCAKMDTSSYQCLRHLGCSSAVVTALEQQIAVPLRRSLHVEKA
jgi:hypothetical protein